MTSKSVAAEGEAKAIVRRIDIPLLTHPLLLKGSAEALLLAGGLMGSFLSFIVLVTGETDAIGAMWTGAAANAATVVGALAGSPGTAGAGILARAQTRGSAAWSGILTARPHPRHHAISLDNAGRTVMIVFCPPDLYDAVAARIERELAAHRGRRRVRRNPLFGLLVRTAIAVVACLPFFVLPWPFELDLFVPLPTLCFALAAVWLIPHLVVVCLGGLARMWFDIAARMPVERRSVLDGSIYRFWTTMRVDHWAPLAITAAATLVLVVLAVGLLRGRYATGLATDEEELELDERPDADTDREG